METLLTGIGFSSPIPSPSEKKWKDRVKRGILLPGGLGQRPGRMSRYLRMIETRDSEFDPEGFLKRVRKAYLRDVLRESENAISQRKQIHVVGASIVQVLSDRLFDAVHVRIKTTARCESCGSLLNDARHHWILGAVRAEAVR